MKLSSSSSTKNISSPGWFRPEKFPPPLLRFLRGNVRTRTRSKSRPVTLFLRKKKNPTTTTTTQEPSSPKVTCIGQVRVRRSKNSGSKKNKPRFDNCGCSCDFVRGPCCCTCSCISWKVFKPVWCIWVRLFCCGSAKVRTESPQTGSNRVQQKNIVQEEDEKEVDNEEREEGCYKASTSKSPPKNALLLTRCRSAPYRSSSLACRLLGETESLKTEQSEEAETKTALKIEMNGVNEKDGEVKKKEGCCENGDRVKEEEGMKLKRSRSEPVRRGSEKLDPLTPEFWIQRRLSNT